MFLLLTYFTPISSVSVADSEQVNASCGCSVSIVSFISPSVHQTHVKNIAANDAWFLVCVWPFCGH